MRALFLYLYTTFYVGIKEEPKNSFCEVLSVEEEAFVGFKLRKKKEDEKRNQTVALWLVLSDFCSAVYWVFPFFCYTT